jgi:hypothetical protein
VRSGGAANILRLPPVRAPRLSLRVMMGIVLPLIPSVPVADVLPVLTWLVLR